MKAGEAAVWSELLRGGNAARSAVVGGGMVIHAVNVFIVATILPTVVHDIGGLRLFAWSTTLYVVASLLGGVASARLLRRMGARPTYRAALAVFALGCAACALAPVMPVLLAGRFVQGLGAGTLSALSFTQVRALFPERLWPRALAVISATWGMATLLGPAIGGVFAQYHAWRAAFWSLLAVTPLLALLVEVALPRDEQPPADVRARMAWTNLALLTGGVLAVSAGSMARAPLGNLLGLGAAVAALALFAQRERAGPIRLLPRSACLPGTVLGATYGTMALLLVGLTTEIFVPYFLQTLHGLPPLYAGYLSALLSGGWTLGSMTSAGIGTRFARPALTAGPLFVCVGLIGLALLMPRPAGPGFDVAVMGACLLGMGLGIGMCWPLLGTRVFSGAAPGEQALAAASITTIVMVANAFGASLGGMVTNLAGMAQGGAAGAAPAAAWLFSLAAAAPLLASLLARRLRATLAAEPRRPGLSGRHRKAWLRPRGRPARLRHRLRARRPGAWR